jgi:hypothetical protein
MPTATGNRAVTGVGFRPDLVMHAHGGAGLTGAPPSTQQHAAQSLGAMNASAR